MTWPWICLYGALWLAVIVLAVLVLGLSSRIGRLEKGRAAGPIPFVPSERALVGAHLPTGPDYDLWLQADETNDASPQHGTVLLFASSSCGPCARLADRLRAHEPPYPDVPVVVVSDAVPSDYEGVPMVSRVVVDRSSASRRLGIVATPMCLLVNRDRMIVEVAVPVGPGEIEELARLDQQQAAPGSLGGIQLEEIAPSDLISISEWAPAADVGPSAPSSAS